MKAVNIPFNRQRTLPNNNEERSVQGQINQIIYVLSFTHSMIQGLLFS